MGLPPMPGTSTYKREGFTRSERWQYALCIFPDAQNQNAKINDHTSWGGDGCNVGISTADVHRESNDRWQRICCQSFQGAVLRTRKSQRYGAVQYYTQYSYLTRAPWFVAPDNPKNAHLSMVYAGIRYVLPSTSGTLLRVPYPN